VGHGPWARFGESWRNNEPHSEASRPSRAVEQRTRAAHTQQIDLRLGDALGAFESGRVSTHPGDRLRQVFGLVGQEPSHQIG
jgi:hypothetical protein